MKKLALMIIAILAMVSVVWAGMSVTLQWSPNSESDLAGYNIYRGLADGGPYTVLGSVPTGTEEFTDSTITFDMNYFYVVTAFDNEVPRNESGYSNQVTFFRETPPNAGSPGVPEDINITLHIIVN